MYGGSTFTWEYVCGYETMEQRKRRVFRKVCRLAIALCLSCLITVICVRLAAVGGLKALTNIRGETETIPAEEKTEAVYIPQEQISSATQTAVVKMQEIVPVMDINLAIALLVREQLKEQGYEVIMSRKTDTYIAKEERVKKANRSGTDIYISIHQNATDEGTGVRGLEVWYEEDDTGRDNKRLAQLIRQQTIKSTGLWNGSCTAMRIFM